MLYIVSHVGYHGPVLRRCSLAFLISFLLVGCSDKNLPSSSPSDPASAVQVSGSERLGWNQLAADEAELGRLQYVVYVDDVRTPLTNVNCGRSATAAGFDCSASLPQLTQGLHTLEIASFVEDVLRVLESGRSAPLLVNMTGVTRGSASSAVPTRLTTADGATLTLDLVAEGLHDPTDIAFGADGAIFLAERTGLVRLVRDGVLVPSSVLDLSSEVAMPNGGLLAIAVDSNFDETGMMYALYAVAAPRNGLEFMLARFRGVGDRFGERAVLLDRISASPEGASGALRIGPDGKLYVALDSAADERALEDIGSWNGKVLRLNTDATTPDDQAAFSPVYSLDHPQPKALAWQPVSGDMWVIDGVDPSGGRLRSVAVSGDRRLLPAVQAGYAIPQGTGAAVATFYHGSLMPLLQGDLFVAAEAGRHLLRIRFDPSDSSRIASVERLLEDEIGPVRVVAEGRDGALYVASDTSLYRLAP